MITDKETTILREHWQLFSIRYITDFIASTMPQEISVDGDGNIILIYTRKLDSAVLTLIFSPDTDCIRWLLCSTHITDSSADPEGAERLVTEFQHGKAPEDLRSRYADTSIDSFRFVSDSIMEMMSGASQD